MVAFRHLNTPITHAQENQATIRRAAAISMLVMCASMKKENCLIKL